MAYEGRPFQAHLHSSDASAGVAIPLYPSGETTSHTVADDEYLEVHSFEFVSEAGGDCFANVGSAAAATASQIIFRGTFAANGGIANGQIEPAWAAPGLGGSLWVTAPVGVVDIVIRGTIRGGSTGTRPSWKA